MSDIAIQVENLGKKYVINHQTGDKYLTFRDAIMNRTKSLVRPFIKSSDDTNQRQHEDFWALNDVSFTIKRGERVGVIGRNGAGKSTLLKVLSKITEPTTGRIQIKGRVASLLEVGTGFHPELTGRENIALNGAILGMSKREINAKFEEIVAFAEVERFLDTPVKRYSSGMYVRLAFAVAAHLETEILIVDEVLAVGDAAFQKKCFGKMEDVAAKRGRTVLFVSHNMTAIQALCEQAILMKNGQTTGIQPVESAINQYSIQSEPSAHGIDFPVVIDEVTIHEFLITQDGFTVFEYESNKPIDVKICFEIDRDLTVFRMGIFLRSNFGECIFRSLIADWEADFETLKKGKYICYGQIPSGLMCAGSYLIELHSSRFGIRDYRFEDLVSTQILVKAAPNYNRAHIDERTFGLITINPKWQLKSL